MNDYNKVTDPLVTKLTCINAVLEDHNQKIKAIYEDAKRSIKQSADSASQKKAAILAAVSRYCVN